MSLLVIEKVRPKSVTLVCFSDSRLLHGINHSYTVHLNTVMIITDTVVDPAMLNNVYPHFL